MNGTPLTSLQRVVTTLAHREPDRVPFFLMVTMHGARELGLSIKEYFSKAENVVEGQLRLRASYHHDCIYAFFYAAVEIEAWGGEVIFFEDGPPNSGTPFIRSSDDIRRLEPPSIGATPCLVKVLKAAEILKARIKDDAPVIGVVISPFSLPIMQMGFDKYLDLIHQQPDLFWHLMKVNEAFCVEWANAQISSGATAIAYFDPMSSPTIVPRELYLKTGFEIARRTIAQIRGATAIHLGSGRCLPILGELATTGTAIVGVSAEEDLDQIKASCRGKLTVLGNLNGIKMRHWTGQQAEAAVKDAIARAGPGGGFILSDNHGEIPWQVPEHVLTALSEAVDRWGRYPLNWVRDRGR